MRPRILLLHDALAAGDRIDTADVLVEAKHITNTLDALGYASAVEPVGLDLEVLDAALERHRPQAVFNLVESLGGRAELIAAVPALLEGRGVPFTGNSADAQHLSSNKLLAKRVLAAAGIPAPPLFDGTGASDARWIIKSVWEHASFGLDDDSIAATPRVGALLARRAAEHGGRWFAEAYVPGREFNVALLAGDSGVAALPPAEIRFDGYPRGKPRIVGYAAKWHGASVEYLSTPRSFDVEAALARRLTELALACWHAFDLAGYARVDFRLADDGTLYVLEVNANPCLSPDAGFAAALAEAGMQFSGAVAALVADALRRRAAGMHAEDLAQRG